MAKKTRRLELPFQHHLVLNQWLFSLFGLDSVSGFIETGTGAQISTLEAFRRHFNLHGETVGRDTEGVHRIIQHIRDHLTNQALLSDEDLLEYDRRIKLHTDSINAGRKIKALEPIEWKYFQYLMLLFAEIYLDYLFTKPDQLVAGLNTQIERWNDKWVENGYKHEPLQLVDPAKDLWPQLNMAAYWSATGSGKTLLMHVNILQFMFYQERYRQNIYGKSREINKIVLLTPNEGLTRQHLAELDASGIPALEFSHSMGGLFSGYVIVIDINKLADQQGDKTVAVSAFGDNNLLLVDEGHRGTAGGSGGVWYRYRRQLAEKGFTFEYSATFAQSGISDRVNKDLGTSLRQSYSRAILFDYSYRHFYADGYGKQSQVLNIEKGVEKSLFAYQMASLLSFYQQMHLYQAKHSKLAPFNLEKPLWVFVTSRVTASDYSAPVANDMVMVLQFINEVLSQPDLAKTTIHGLLNEGLIAKGGVDYLYGRFNYLKQLNKSPDDLYSDLLSRVFHSNGGNLYLENITGQQGEIALRAGESGIPFGVINVGEPAKLLELCEDHGLIVQDSRFSDSLFDEINKSNSRVNLLLGARKFTEGWSSWRVSNMTLLNVGRGQGAQIIQLFGRGVRLKGWNTTLKRSADLGFELLSHHVERPKHIGILETLNIFGLNANYIDEFRRQLDQEGIPINEGLVEVEVPLVHMENLPQDLNVVRVKEQVANRAIGGAGSAFLELAEQVVLVPPHTLSDSGRAYFYDPPRVVVDFYPQIRGFATDDKSSIRQGQTQRFEKSHLMLLDMDQLYFELLEFKRNKRWANLTISPGTIRELLNDHQWYELQAPSSLMELGDLSNLTLWHDMAISLLRKYCEMFYNYRRKQWEGDKLEFKSIAADKRYLPNARLVVPDGGYLVTLDPIRQEGILREIQQIKEKIAQNKVQAWQNSTVGGTLRFLFSERHFYQPLLASTGANMDYTVSPVPLNMGEAEFVTDVHDAWCTGAFPVGAEVYLLRNIVGRDAVGVFIDGGFQPDFILWIKHNGLQHVVFVDPKGLRHHSLNDPKVRFYKTIKDLECTLHANNPDMQHVKLHSFLLSQTGSAVLELKWGETQQSLESRNILFPGDDSNYILKLVSGLGI